MSYHDAFHPILATYNIGAVANPLVTQLIHIRTLEISCWRPLSVPIRDHTKSVDGSSGVVILPF